MLRVSWFRADDLTPPHAVSHPNHVIELANAFVTSGWDMSKPALIGYPWANGIQLLSGSHRWIAAKMANIEVPCVVLSYQEVEEAWGDLNKWTELMKRGNNDQNPIK